MKDKKESTTKTKKETKKEVETNNKKSGVVKNVFWKVQNIVGDAAKTTVDTAGKTLKSAQSIINKTSDNIAQDRIRKQEEKNQSRIRKNREKNNPIFKDTIPHSLPKMVNIVDYDKRLEDEGCENAIAFKDNKNDLEILTMCKNGVSNFDEIAFLPDNRPASTVYYVHPIDTNQYIEISKYFSYLEEQKVAELEQIAQDLGAKHFMVRIMRQKTSNVSKSNSLSANLKMGRDKAKVSVETEDSNKSFESIGIASESTWPGKDPKEPKLKFWANNESIKNLIKQRLSDENRLQTKIFRLAYNNSTGIKEKDAAKIDGALKGLGFGASGKIQKTTQEEAKKIFEYTIDF